MTQVVLSNFVIFSQCAKHSHVKSPQVNQQFFLSVKDGKLNTLVSSHTNTLLIYEDVSLIWAAQLPHVPVAVRVANFQ